MRSIRLTFIAILALVWAASSQAASLEPLAVGWEQFFTIDWEPGDRAGRPVIRGRLVNHSPHAMTGVQLLVDGLDANGHVLGQRVSWVTGGTLSPSTSLYFEVPAPGPHAQYRVRVFAYDRLEGGSSGPGFL